jgi:N4-(beta-N-acetylglucosaminyl)-L-asparaginase
MIHRRRFLQLGSLGAGIFLSNKLFAAPRFSTGKIPLVISTWDAGFNANKAAWQVLRNDGRALDAVEQGVMVTESEQSCCVGLAAYPDRDGYVTLDASIMDEHGNAGGVAFLERIKHPISVARRVMEKTPHVLLVGSGAQQFAVSEGFALEEEKLSDNAKKAYEEWLKKSQYKPVINIENTRKQNSYAPNKINGLWNHDTIGMLAIDAKGNLSGSCTTSGMAFKMRGRVGDSPIIGAGLYVDNEAGAAVATGVGEEVLKICGTHLIVEMMRQNTAPEDACRKAIERIIKRNGDKIKDIQVGFLAINKKGEYGAYSVQKGFNYALCYADDNNSVINTKHVLP